MLIGFVYEEARGGISGVDAFSGGYPRVGDKRFSTERLESEKLDLIDLKAQDTFNLDDSIDTRKKRSAEPIFFGRRGRGRGRGRGGRGRGGRGRGRGWGK